jgi:hypothetical protein
MAWRSWFPLNSPGVVHTIFVSDLEFTLLSLAIIVFLIVGCTLWFSSSNVSWGLSGNICFLLSFQLFLSGISYFHLLEPNGKIKNDLLLKVAVKTWTKCLSSDVYIFHSLHIVQGGVSQLAIWFLHW